MIDKSDLIVASAATAAEIEWFDGYGIAPGGVSILGPRDAFREIEAPSVTGNPIGLLFVKGKAVASVLAAPEPVEAAPEPDVPFELFKTDVLSRMTDDELDGFDEELATASTRERRMWIDCTRLVSTDPYFEGLKAKFAAAFGEDRAKAILAR
ncbi:hypothetical protein [Methylobacterium adhaesivum]|uniref:Uncharacterized protein n=1 Tax=Methylobacterium adhaesivum TaxID=333297 RepID=A0ABT8BLP4_9HYPH|nr:hypothetical protein [Methylobacterium adhaesivum]MDN3592118.1 hypothetical protein [Methylobacterium adhaesivum]